MCIERCIWAVVIFVYCSLLPASGCLGFIKHTHSSCYEEIRNRTSICKIIKHWIILLFRFELDISAHWKRYASIRILFNTYRHLIRIAIVCKFASNEKKEKKNWRTSPSEGHFVCMIVSLESLVLDCIVYMMSGHKT